LLAAALDDVDVQHVRRFLRAQKIDLAGRKSWCESNDPAFIAKAADVVGLYMAPAENAIVICVDEALDPGAGASTGLSQAPGAMAPAPCSLPSRWQPARSPAAHKTRRRRTSTS
jgi:hypothetical protein